jgi:3-hydroxyacyl-[acyl-carrier-protein] dehydratase
MRFILVDRILAIEKGKEGSFLKNVTQSEDYFTDHFPESPIMPGVLILESFDQASQLFVSYTHEFESYPELQQISKVSFKHYVVPGDQLHIRLQLVREDEEMVVIKAEARVGGKVVSEATLEFRLIEQGRHPEAAARCRRLKAHFEFLSSDTVGRGWESLASRP